MAIYRTAVRHTYPVGGPDGINVFHFRTTVDQSSQSSILQSAADALEAFYNGISTLFPVSSTFTWEGQWSQVDGDTFLAPFPQWSVSGDVTIADGYLPPATAYCITWYSSEASQSGRGRTFLGPLSGDASTNNGAPTAATVAQVGASAQALIDSFAGPEPGDEGAWGVYSRTDSVIRDFVGYRTPLEFAVLRSRRD